MNKTKHNIVADGPDWGHSNGKYGYHCTECLKYDWLPAYGKLEHLNFYNTTCTPYIPKLEPIPKTNVETQLDRLEEAYKLLQEQHTRDMKDKQAYIEMVEKRHAVYIAERNEVIKNLKEEINQLHYTVKGACSEHLHLRINVSPDMMASSNERDLAQFMTEKANKQMAHAVEKQLGDRYELHKEYDRALRHIYYLENHVKSVGVSFTEFGMPLKFK